MTRFAIAALVVLAAPAAPLAAQDPGSAVPLADLIGAFLIDSGVRTAGLPWTTGEELPIRWASAAPVANPDRWTRDRGMTHLRGGEIRVTLGDSVNLPMQVTAMGTAAGLARVVFSFASLQVDSADGGGFFVHREMIEDALRHDGMVLQPIKCNRTTEGASYGNLVDAARLPGKNASGLWWFWQSAQQELQVTLTLLYRRAEMSEVECYSG